jgi:hypothetical protein
MKRGPIVLLAAVVLLAAGSVGWLTRGRWSDAAGPGGVAAPVVHDSVRAPAGTRVRVQVLNASRRRGLARRATIALRDRGFDVVEVGTTSVLRDSTLVLDRSGHSAWAQLVAAALGGAPVEARADSSRYVDVTVLLGASWRPPAQPLHP